MFWVVVCLFVCLFVCSLDPEGDPLCILLMMDYYALRCDQYDFLLNLYQQWEVREGAAVQTGDIECKYY